MPHVLRHGADWYKQWGTPQSTGFRVFCLSGQVKYPGLYELPHGTPLRELIYDFGGGLTEEAGELKAVIPGGLSVQLLDPSQLDTPLDYENLAKQAGTGLGRGDRHRRKPKPGRGGPAHAGVLPRRELRQMHAVSLGARRGSKRSWSGSSTARAAVQYIAVLMTYIADMIGGKSFCPFSYAAVSGVRWKQPGQVPAGIRRRHRRGNGAARHPGAPDLSARHRCAVRRDAAELGTGGKV